MAKSKKGVLSRVKLAKAGSRATLGSPPTERVLPDITRKRTEQPRFRETLAGLLERQGKENR